jgi:hypothetical protein
VVPTVSTSVETSILTLIRSGTTFTAESVLTSYVTLSVSLSATPSAVSPASQPAEPTTTPGSDIPPSSSPSLSVSEGSTCSSYGPSLVPNASACGGTSCHVEYEVGSILKWQQYPEKPPVVTEMVFVSVKHMA